MTDAPETPLDPNADLETMDFMTLTIEYERLKEKGRKAAADSTRDILQMLDTADLFRLTKIIQIKRQLAGGKPKESKASSKAKAPKKVASESDLLSL